MHAACSRGMECPEAEVLVELAHGGLPIERRAEIANHAAGCALCLAAIDALVPTCGSGRPAAPPAKSRACGGASARSSHVAP